MNEHIKQGNIGKFYMCAVHGRLEKKSATLKGWLFKDSKTNKVYVTDERQKGSKEIITAYRVVGEKKDSSLLEVNLITGRTHQIRAHMAHIGHPLIGDGKYGINRDDRAKGYKYQALYAYLLRFNFDKSTPTDLDSLSGKEVKLKKSDSWFLSDLD
jgi:23S rRNA pseudouridine955/2504/2580 synthase